MKNAKAARQPSSLEQPLIGDVLDNGTGAIVLEFKKGYSWTWIVLAIIPKRREFVSWVMNKKGETYHGHYCVDLSDALKEYQGRG